MNDLNWTELFSFSRNPIWSDRLRSQEDQRQFWRKARFKREAESSQVTEPKPSEETVFESTEDFQEKAAQKKKDERVPKPPRPCREKPPEPEL